MVNVSHHRYDRRTGYPILLVIIFLISVDRLDNIRAYIFSLITELLSHNIDRLRIQALIDRNHKADAHASTNNLRYRYVHHVRQVVGRNELGQLQYLAFQFFLFHQLVLTFHSGVTFITTVFSPLIILIILVGQASQSLLDLLLNILFTNFRFHRLLQARLTVVIRTIVTIRARIIRTRRIIHVYPIFLDTFTLLLSVTFLTRFSRSVRFNQSRRIRTLMRSARTVAIITRPIVIKLLLLITLFPLLLLRFLFRTSRLVKRIQVNLTGYLDL
ncbi:unknown [Parabacteroides sp. CAG:2]|nr:unknown [Parabacteroides sp. CAG:2]